MSILSDIKVVLEDNIKDNSIVLNKNIIPFKNIATFLESLPDKELPISVPSIDRIILSSHNVPQVLTLEGQLFGYWSIKGIDNHDLKLTQIKLLFIQNDIKKPVETTFTITGSLNIEDELIPVRGKLTEGNRLDFNLIQSTKTHLSFTEIADYVNYSSMREYLPLETEIFNSVIITALNLNFGFDNSTTTELSIACKPDVREWSIIPNFVSLKNLELLVSSKCSTWTKDRFILSSGGNINGTFYIGQKYDITIYFQNKSFCELNLVPINGSILPELSELAVFSGGESLNTTVQNTLEQLGLEEISIKGVNIGLDLQSKSLSYLSLASQIVVAGITIDLFTRLPDFEFAGSKSKNSVISLKTLIYYYFGYAENIPDLNITEFVFTAYPSTKSYAIHTIIEDVWDLTSSKKLIAITELEMSLVKSSDNIDASITASISIADINIFISADSPDDIKNGWNFEGKTATNDDIKLETIINDLAAKFKIDKIISSTISDLIIRNIKISFNTKTKDFTFTCESELSIDGKQVDIAVAIDIQQQQDGSYNKYFSGHINISGLQFALIFDKDENSKSFVAAYHDPNDTPIEVRDLVGSISSELQHDIPSGLSFSLKDALFLYSQQKQVTNFLLGLNMGSGINLSKLPLVGEEFSPEQTVKLDYQVIVTKANFKLKDINRFRALYSEGGISLPNKSINDRLDLITLMQLGDEIKQLNLPVTVNKDSGQLEPGNSLSEDPGQPASTTNAPADVISTDGMK